MIETTIWFVAPPINGPGYIPFEAYFCSLLFTPNHFKVASTLLYQVLAHYELFFLRGEMGSGAVPRFMSVVFDVGVATDTAAPPQVDGCLRD